MLTIKATPPFKLPEAQPIEVSIISEIGLENLQRKGSTTSKKLDAAGKDGSATKEPPKKDVKAPPPPPAAPPPAAAAEPPPPPPEPPKPDQVAALIEKQPPPEPKKEPEPPKVEPQPTPDDQAALQKKLEDAEKQAAEEARQRAEAKAKADAEARQKELERQKKLAAEKKKRDEALKKKREAEAKAKAEADAKAKAFNPDAIAKAIENSSEDGKQQLLKDNRQVKAAQPAGEKSDTASKNRGPRAGNEAGGSDKLTATQLALFGQIMRDSVSRCMNINAGAEGMERLAPFEIEVRLKPDGQLAAPPKLISQGAGQLFTDASNSALRALINCAPYTNLPSNLYTGGWDHMIVPFDVARMYRR
jgi:colicin import membrane protein